MDDAEAIEKMTKADGMQTAEDPRKGVQIERK